MTMWTFRPPARWAHGLLWWPRTAINNVMYGIVKYFCIFLLTVRNKVYYYYYYNHWTDGPLDMAYKLFQLSMPTRMVIQTMALHDTYSWLWHDDVIKWKHFPRYWPVVRGIHRSPVNSPYKGQRRGALIFPLICAWTSTRANNRETGDLRRHRAHYDVTVMWWW